MVILISHRESAAGIALTLYAVIGSAIQSWTLFVVFFSKSSDAHRHIRLNAVSLAIYCRILRN